MSILKRLYASSGSEIIHEVLEVSDGVTTYRMTQGWDELTVTLETGEVVACTPCGMELALPARNDDGTQDLTFALSNVDGKASGFVREALRDQRTMSLVYRTYTSDDLGAPAHAPHRFRVKGGTVTATQLSVTAGYFDLLDTRWPRNTYNLNAFPGLRYI
ncbi:MAG: DUF1833 family protein [Pseudomonas sp.]